MNNPTHSEIKCSNCAFYQPMNGTESHCRRQPPIILATNKLAHIWPTVTDSEWCGEFLHKLEYLEAHKKYLP